MEYTTWKSAAEGEIEIVKGGFGGERASDP